MRVTDARLPLRQESAVTGQRPTTPAHGPFPGLPTFGELHAELARHRLRDPDAKLIAAYDALLVLCERIAVLEAEARKPYMPAARVRAMGGYDPEDTACGQDGVREARVAAPCPEAAPHDPEDTALD